VRGLSRISAVPDYVPKRDDPNTALGA